MIVLHASLRRPTAGLNIRSRALVTAASALVTLVRRVQRLYRLVRSVWAGDTPSVLATRTRASKRWYAIADGAGPGKKHLEEKDEMER